MKVEYVPGRDAYETEQYGPRRLWDEVAAAYRDWHAAGSPPRSAHRISINPSRESIGTG